MDVSAVLLDILIVLVAAKVAVEIAELGVILLLPGVGLEMDLGELGAVGRAASSVAVVGIVVPMVGGYAVATALGHDSLTDRNGRKLDDAAKAALIDAVSTGVTRKRKRFGRRA